jgi:hypothetical protein
VTSRTHGGVLTISSGGCRAFAVLWIAILGVFPTVMIVGVLLAMDQGVVAAGVLGAIGAIALWRVARQRCSVSATDLVVHDILRTRRVPRSQINAIRHADPEWGTLLARGQPTGWWLRVELHDGTRFHPGALARRHDTSDWEQLAAALALATIEH